ncbi:MAG: gluconolaconase [Planctomycetales bacterium 12-60-4]|nr:MAG: gluconolaconase [Planctomycetales bacterium 12-60-4]
MRSLQSRSWTALVGILVAVIVTADAAEPAPQREALLKMFVDELVEIRPGTDKFPATFRMGSADGTSAEKPPQQITLKSSFWIAKYEVPQNLYEAVTGKNPSRWKGPRNSVEMMAWREAVQFCETLTKQLQEQKLIGSDEVIRLPTEAEWEYCCRAGTETPYSFGAKTSRETDPEGRRSILDEYAWYTGNAAGNDPPVGALKPNPWGLYDMHGYLWEFTADPWTPTLTDRGDSAVAEGDDALITLRGGSWKDPAERLTSSYRRSLPVVAADDAVGIRCVRAQAR